MFNRRFVPATQTWGVGDSLILYGLRFAEPFRSVLQLCTLLDSSLSRCCHLYRIFNGLTQLGGPASILYTLAKPVESWLMSVDKPHPERERGIVRNGTIFWRPSFTASAS